MVVTGCLTRAEIKRRREVAGNLVTAKDDICSAKGKKEDPNGRMWIVSGRLPLQLFLKWLHCKTGRPVAAFPFG